MTYGDNTAQMRQELVTLLQQHRIQVQLGGANGKRPPINGADDRRAMGAVIAQYRRSLMAWSAIAIETAMSRLDPRGGRHADDLRVVRQLHDRLRSSLDKDPNALPSLTQLTSTSPVPTVDSWRLAARAAALAEHDFDPAGTGMTSAGWFRILSDASSVIEAVTVLDRRYRDIPGWQHMDHRGSIAIYAYECSRLKTSGETGHHVDVMGWRAPLVRVAPEAATRFEELVVAQRNLLVALHRFPDALNLRRVLHAQSNALHDMTVLAEPQDPLLAHRWSASSRTYDRLVRQTRDLASLMGDGGAAATDAARAARAAREASRFAHPSSAQLERLDRLLANVDAQVMAILDHGVSRSLYTTRQPQPTLGERSHLGIVSLRGPYAPVRRIPDNELLATARSGLRSAPSPLRDSNFNDHRLDLRRAIDAQPASTRPLRAL